MSTKMFALFRYQIIPVTTQFNLMYDINEVIRRKNEEFFEKLRFFAKRSDFTGKKAYNFNIDRRDDTLALLTVQRRKNVKIINEDKFEETVDSFPYINIFVDNDPEQQILAVEISKDYSNPKSIVKYFNEKMNALLEESHLAVKISPLYKKSDFWSFIEEHKDKISRINFELITPNMSNISHSLSEELKGLSKSTKSSVTNLNICAEKGKSLVIDQQNQGIASMVDYSSNGGGEIAVSVRDSKVKFRTNDYQTSVEIGEADMRLSLKDVVALIRSMHEDNR
ncbi:MAG: hypothetical protein PUB69_00610 [Desulfovibrionaceae bacterium]|nr:hypothetical protein [Desulfovibrionaceae bacterium]